MWNSDELYYFFTWEKWSKVVRFQSCLSSQVGLVFRKCKRAIQNLTFLFSYERFLVHICTKSIFLNHFFKCYFCTLIFYFSFYLGVQPFTLMAVVVMKIWRSSVIFCSKLSKPGSYVIFSKQQQQWEWKVEHLK